MARAHQYSITTTWAGNLGSGTSGYRDYSRNHDISGGTKIMPIPGSADPTFRGDGTRYNPEELFVGSLSACHMLWMLHLCADAGIVVTSYTDLATGTMVERPDGSGEFTEVTLRPKLTLADPARTSELANLHDKAHKLCFIARSVKCPVTHEPVIE